MHRHRHQLDAIQDPRHLSYKIPGLLAWLVLGLGLAGTWFFPRVFVTGAQIFALVLATRLLVTVLCYLLGLVRCHRQARRAVPDGAGPPGSLDPEVVHHVVLIPNYQEPVELLRATLQRLAEQAEASQRLTVVLAMEEREPGVYQKACALRDQFAARFARVLVTVHPADLPGEIAGKGSNQAWAARRARRDLVDGLGLSLEHLTLTSCDADSLFHPRYFEVLTHAFAGDPKRHLRFWCAPVLYDNNIWEVPALIRLLTFASGASRLAELAGPLSLPLPMSTYSFSFKLADQVGYWDPFVISEDWNMYLRCLLGSRGRVRVQRTFLSFSADSVSGQTPWQAVANYYRQQVRHAWGAQNVGYLLQQWRRTPGVPALRRLLYLSRVALQHLLWSTSWFLLVQGWILSIQTSAHPGDPWRVAALLPEPFRYFGLVWTVGTAIIWLADRLRARPGPRRWRLATLAAEFLAWAAWPLVGLVLFALPALHAQTKMLLGSRLVYRRTPKTLAGRAPVGQHPLKE